MTMDTKSSSVTERAGWTMTTLVIRRLYQTEPYVWQALPMRVKAFLSFKLSSFVCLEGVSSYRSLAFLLDLILVLVIRFPWYEKEL